MQNEEDSSPVELTPKEKRLTPLTSLVPILVTNPLTLSDLKEEITRVEPGS